ncbi:MAG: S24 family peptidase [Planctomycetota bacterium]
MVGKNSIEDVAARLREFRALVEGGLTQRAFAERLGIDQQRLSSYEMGTRIPHHVIASLMRMGANPEWLLFGTGPVFRESEKAEAIRSLALRLPERGAAVEEEGLSEFYVLPLYADEAAAGEPLEMRDTAIEGPAIIHRAWCPHPEETDYVRIATTGTSMAPTIPAGAIVTIDRSVTDPEVLVGKIVAIGLRDDGVTVKRLARTERGGFVGVPDNPSGEHRAIPLDEGDRIIGKVNTVHAWVG